VEQWYNSRCWLFVERLVYHRHIGDGTDISVSAVIK
jgi:hypothetical protein